MNSHYSVRVRRAHIFRASFAPNGPSFIIGRMLYARRPLSVTLVAFGGFLLGGWNLWRALVLVRRRPFLNALDVSLDPLWRAGMALLWAVLFLAAALAVWQGRGKLRWLSPVILAGYAFYHLIVQLIFAASPLALQGWGAALVADGLVWVALVWALYRPATRAYWRRRDGPAEIADIELMRIADDDRSQDRAIT